MVSTVIVAIPAVDDKVYRISSEKVPHMTLCFLGDQVSGEDSATIVEFVQHAAAQLSPFGMTVDYRGELGPDQADVLFFEKGERAYSFDRINSFRAHLLQNDTIQKAYQSVDQYPEWTPHLTLGYPTAPAKPDESDYPGIGYVQFDRIAVWIGDFSGPEFRLKYDDYPLEVAMSDMTTTELGEQAVNELFHHGVKGMRWGVRKGDHPDASRRTNKEAASDAKEFARAKMFFGEGAGTRRKLIKAKVQAKSAKDPSYKKAFDHHLAKQDLGQHGEKARSERRRKDVRKSTTKTARGVHRELTGGFGNVSLASKILAEGVRVATHSDISGEDEMTSTTERGADAVRELFHHGVKGMKWGVRNDKGHEGEQVKTKQLGKLDKQWEKQNTGVAGFIKVHNAVADRMNNGEIDKFNNEPRWKKAADDGHLSDDNHPETKAYFDAYEKLSNKMFAEEATKLGSNPSGTKKYELREDADGNPYAYLAPVSKGAMEHAEGETGPAFRIVRNDDGTIMTLDDITLELKHYGVKGMRWGVTTKDRASQRTPTPVTATQTKPGTFTKTSGGKNLPAHEDAINALVARQKAKKSTTDALSNQELRTAVERMQLEQKYSQLSFANDRRSRGARFAAGFFGQRKDLKFKDMDEEFGQTTRDAVKKVMDEKAKMAEAAAKR